MKGRGLLNVYERICIMLSNREGVIGDTRINSGISNEVDMSIPVSAPQTSSSICWVMNVRREARPISALSLGL